MARDEAYQKAEQKIEAVRRSGAKELDLSVGYFNNKLKLRELPESLGQLTQLKTLNLSSNQLTALPASLGQLTQLQRLSLSHNALTALPELLGQLTQLQRLVVTNNALTALPESVGQLTQLQTLELSANQLTALPESLGQLTQLQRLNVSGNQLTALPESLGQLTQLTSLELDNNQLTELPESLGQLTQLGTLLLSSNLFVSLPDWLGNLAMLVRLEVRANRLSDLPSVLPRLKRLSEVDFHGNSLNAEAKAAYYEGFDAVMRYLRAKAEAQVVLNEAKLILIGEGEVGKSCLLGALRGDQWEEGRPTTHGIEIKPVKLTDPATGTEITLNGLDFGGQRVYRPTHQLFFSAPAVYLVVWKPREGPQQGFVKEWIKLVKHREPDAKILVVATHGGPRDRQPDIDRQEIWDLFGRETVIDFFHVDSRPPNEEPKTGKRSGACKGVKELKDAIARVAASLPEVGRKVPQHWQQARKALTKSKEAYLPLDRVFAICKEHKVEEEDARLLLRICRRVGDLIHYEHDPALHDIVVLKPDWLATAMSFVLDDKQTRDAHGLVSFTRLGELWNDRARAEEFRYEARLHPLFVRLMERFDLSYKVSLAKDAADEIGFWERVGSLFKISSAATPAPELHYTSLIAQLVPDVRPKDEELLRAWPLQPGDGDEQQVQICRIVDAKGNSSAAEGLFYQLIVRLHKLSLGRDDFKASVHWQRGLILDDDYNGRALLEHVGNDVRLTVRAAYPGNLLAVLTREVKWLVEDFWEGLRCEVVVPCIEPCGKKLPGTGVFEVQKLIAFKRQGMTLFPCTVSGCNQLQDMDCLLQNAPAARRTSIESLLADGFGEMRSRLEDLRQQNLVLDQGLRRIMSQVDDAFRGVMRMSIDEAKEGPRLFSLQPVERSAFNPNGWAKKKFHITLWCEHTRLPLPLINKNDDKGVYEFDVTREWFAKAAPFLKVLAGTLSLVLPVAASATKLALDEAAYKALENQLDFGKDCAEAMLTTTEKTAEWFAEKEGPEAERTGVIRADGGVLREFQTWLKKEDASFGDLRRVLNKRQEFLWVHRNFEKEY
jgi:hypothetical protein